MFKLFLSLLGFSSNGQWMKNDKQTSWLRKMLHESTQAYEMLAKTFYKAKLKKEPKWLLEYIWIIYKLR